MSLSILQIRSTRAVNRRGPLNGVRRGASTTKALHHGHFRSRAREIVPSDCIYQIMSYVPSSLSVLWLPRYFNGSVQDTPYEQGVIGSLVPTSFYAAGAIDQGQTGSLEQIQNMTQNITDSMTTYIRWHGNSNTSTPINGTAYRNTVCVRVRWGYIAYSASITGLLLVFFIAMVINTRSTERKMLKPAQLPNENREKAAVAHHHDFKSSALATIFHGLDRQSLDALARIGASNTESELLDIAKKRLVSLVLTDSGWKFSMEVRTGPKAVSADT